jgi:hypothetical protein
LRIGLLVLASIGHDDGRPVDDLDRATVKQPRSLRSIVNVPAGASGEVPDEFLGQSLSGLAVTPRVRGDRGEALIVAEFLESLDGFIAGVIVGDHLREEEAQGDPGTIDPVSPLMTAETAGRLDGGAREEVEKREAVSSAEPVSNGMDLVAS